jgi:hypothetical protein
LSNAIERFTTNVGNAKIRPSKRAASNRLLHKLTIKKEKRKEKKQTLNANAAGKCKPTKEAKN